MVAFLVVVVSFGGEGAKRGTRGLTKYALE